MIFLRYIKHINTCFQFTFQCTCMFNILYIRCWAFTAGSPQILKHRAAMMARYEKHVHSSGYSSWVPAPTWWLTIICNSSSRRLDALFWLWQLLDTRGEHTCRQNTQKHKLKFKMLPFYYIHIRKYMKFRWYSHGPLYSFLFFKSYF